MFTFTDENGYRVDLRFDAGPFAIEPKHVLVFVQHEGKWLCTVHQTRGIEIPGGKQEPGETLEQAAVREVYEETSVVIGDVEPFAHYVVHDATPFCKMVYTGRVQRVEPFVGELETEARLWLTVEEIFAAPNLSFYMKDAGMKKMLEEVIHYERQW